MAKKHFRIYGKEGDKIWKLFWASQGKDKDIQYAAHVSGGNHYTSIHHSGIIHNTFHGDNGVSHYPETKRKWTLSTFKYFDKLEQGGISKSVIRSIPLAKQINKKKIFLFDLENFDEVNFWSFLVEMKYIKQVVEQMKRQFPGVIFAYPENFEPILLIQTSRI